MAFDITSLRLQNQHLTNPNFQTPQEVVSHLGAVQSQDYAAAKWSLGLRIKNSTDVDIEKAFNDGAILRTHVMRPTWHFITPSDIRWMQELTSSRVKTFMAHYNRKLELDDALFVKSNAAIIKALQNHNYLTRQELKTIVAGIGIQTDVQRLAHIIMWAELDALICSGPRRGKQFTYALLEERVPKVKKINRHQALAKLTLKYFTSHGPAQLKDFSWWSGLSLKEAAAGLDMIKPKLTPETLGNKTYWFLPTTHHSSPTTQTAFLLSIYDEYVIAYKDRTDLNSQTRDIEKMISMGNALTAVIILNGKVAGTWKRKLNKNTVEIKLSLFRKLNPTEKQALESQATRYGKFLGLPAELAVY